MRVSAILSPIRYGSLPWLLAVALLGIGSAETLAVYRLLPGICGALTVDTVSAVTRSSIAAIGWPSVMSGWAIMLIGMMPPLVSAPLNHILASSLPRRRARATLVFLAAYGAVWMIAGLILVPMAVAAMLVLGSYAFVCALAFALVWSCSPLAQLARNKCHRLVRIGIGGWRADRDCARQGWAVAPWCIMSCWPWMLAAMVADKWHLAAMIAFAALLLLDRMLPSATVRWRMPPVSNFIRMALRDQKVVGSR